MKPIKSIQACFDWCRVNLHKVNFHLAISATGDTRLLKFSKKQDEPCLLQVVTEKGEVEFSKELSGDQALLEAQKAQVRLLARLTKASKKG